MTSFIKFYRSEETSELMKKPKAFTLLALIARRARRTNTFNVKNLLPGEALIGDYKSCGLSESEYRTAKRNLQKWELATFRSTNRGTIAKLTSTEVFDINCEHDDNLHDTKTTKQRRTNYEQVATNKNVIKNEKNEKEKTRDCPDWLNVDLFKEYEELRIKLKKPMTDRAVSMAIERISKLRNEGHDPSKVIEASIFNCWMDFYPLKENSIQVHESFQSKSLEQNNQSMIEDSFEERTPEKIKQDKKLMQVLKKVHVGEMTEEEANQEMVKIKPELKKHIKKEEEK